MLSSKLDSIHLPPEWVDLLNEKTRRSNEPSHHGWMTWIIVSSLPFNPPNPWLIFFATKINYTKNWEALIQLGLEYLTFEFEYRVLWSSVLEWFNFGMVRTIQKWNYYLRINDGSQMFVLRMVWLSGFQMAFEYQTIGHTTSFQPLEYQTSLAFRSPLQWGSEIWPVEIWKHSKSRLFEGRISNGPYVVRFQMVPNIQKLENCGFSQDCFICKLFFVYNN